MKDPRWKQANPRDQKVVILSSLEGHLDNCKDGVISVGRFLEKAKDHTNQLEQLIPFLYGDRQW